MGDCQTRFLNNGGKYYFNEAIDELNDDYKKDFNDENKSMGQRVSLICSLINVDSSNKHKVELFFFSDNERKISNSNGFTEIKSKNEQNINFEKFFKLFHTSLGSIMGRRKETLIRKLNNGSDIEIK